MGRTIPTFRIASVMEKMNGNHFESVLDKSDRKVFDRVFSIAHLYNSACNMVIQAILPTMKNQRNGRIANVFSMGGRIAIPLDSAYHGTKFALEGVSESLQYEVEQFGIKIIIMDSVDNS